MKNNDENIENIQAVFKKANIKLYTVPERNDATRRTAVTLSNLGFEAFQNLENPKIIVISKNDSERTKIVQALQDEISEIYLWNVYDLKKALEDNKQISIKDDPYGKASQLYNSGLRAPEQNIF